MAEAQEDRPVDMRRRILEEGIRLFGENGFEGTSIQAIADAVGIRKPSLLYHFKSKEELRQAVMRDLLTHWQQELPRLLAGSTSGHDRFSSTIQALVGFFLSDSNRARVAIRESLDRPEELRKMASELVLPWTRLLIEYIRMGQEAKIIKREVDPESYIMQVMMMAIGTVALGHVVSALTDADSQESMDKRIKELVRIARDTLFVTPNQDE
jgi:TetR/AcrR family transcriptional regulator